MKKIIVIALTFILVNVANAQESLFTAFENNDEVTSVLLNKQAFKMLKSATKNSKDADEYKDLVSGLDELRVLTTENSATANEMRATFEKYLKKNNLIELMRINDKDANVKIYVKEGKSENYVTEFLMLVDEMNISDKMKGHHETELVIVSLTGNINLDDVAKITADMNIPGSEHVQEAGDK